ncbi:hypothetical protein LEP1GSC062_0035 [Leptospira alexanderi serovar Manhao 3 str. L 60]|uniref:Uncharacterized protein n=1 Tax=Leptospira alexanderi serovar Manhao 3 str. L 60 TaxID=1049759 RepID=V6ID58_9LEPT|nr:hypothetical protein LEP1GSC062_0035 [Leptospira alexanderi serovar Manhao 3 str. L 60]
MRRALSNQDRNFSLDFGTNTKFITKELDDSHQFSKGCQCKPGYDLELSNTIKAN